MTMWDCYIKEGVLLSKDVEEMKLQIHKVQCVIPEIQDEEKLLGELDVLQMEKRLSLLTMVVRGSHDEIMTKIRRNILCLQRQFHLH